MKTNLLTINKLVYIYTVYIYTVYIYTVYIHYLTCWKKRKKFPEAAPSNSFKLDSFEISKYKCLRITADTIATLKHMPH